VSPARFDYRDPPRFELRSEELDALCLGLRCLQRQNAQYAPGGDSDYQLRYLLNRLYAFRAKRVEWEAELDAWTEEKDTPF
jgi:hypothetical protein